ncbi:MAG: nitroreductase family protein [Candidatus Wallbacteria bacterium]|nr:nitroreductase family protein [Candidatus Wallbacteria bacterium]
MEFLDLVKTRRSVRKYQNRPVSRELIDKCLEAARLAPSACNSQPWSFVICDTPESTARLSDLAFSGIYKMNNFAGSAPVLITVITEKSESAARLGGFFRGTRFALIDVGMACEHLALQAAELGLGTCFFGWFNERAVKKQLGIPRSKKADLMISLGYPADEAVEKNRKKLDEIRRYSGY